MLISNWCLDARFSERVVAEAKDHCGAASSYGHCKGQVVSSFGQSKGRKLRWPITGSIPARERCAGKKKNGTNHEIKEIRIAAGNAGPDDFEDAARAGAAARFRHCAAHRAGEPRRSSTE